jgi:hypothetical protein
MIIYASMYVYIGRCNYMLGIYLNNISINNFYNIFIVNLKFCNCSLSTRSLYILNNKIVLYFKMVFNCLLYKEASADIYRLSSRFHWPLLLSQT